MTAVEIIAANGLHVPSTSPGRYYSICPKCSANRRPEHQKQKVVGVTIDDKGGVQFGCNHCGWTGGRSSNGHVHGEWEVVASYDYCDETGELLFQKIRSPNKKFWQRRPDGHGKWINNTMGVRKVLYRLPEVRAAIAAGQPILCVEGEKDANTLWKLGIAATCNPDGASEPGKRSKWRKEYSELLAGADIVIIPDHDPAGYAHAKTVASMSIGRAKRVRMLELAKHWPECLKGGDVSDWLAAGHVREELDFLITDAAEAVTDDDVGPPPVTSTPDFGVNSYDPLTEDSAALTFAERHRDHLRFDHDQGKWFKWTGTYWKLERTKLAFAWARDLARELVQDKAPKARIASGKTSFASGVERFAQADRAFAVTTELWDPDQYVLGTPAGTVDLRTGKIRAPIPGDFITKITAVTPAATADCPIWLQFLHEATAGDANLVAYLQRFSGYLLTGDTREHALMFIYGPGGNGKSVFLNVITAILGDYARIAAMETFTNSHGDRHPTDLAMLRGARLVCATETEEGRAWAESRIKQLTGGDPISARFMRQDFFTYTPQFKITIVGNHKPALRNVDEAARRRLNIVPFIHQPPKPDQHLEHKLRAEWPTILRWMIDGCLAWQRDGLARPKVVVAATEEYFTEQDVIHSWVEECCETGHRAYSDTSANLFKSWSAYAIASGEKPGTQRWFAQSLARLGFQSNRDKHSRGFDGIRLKIAASHHETEADRTWP